MVTSEIATVLEELFDVLLEFIKNERQACLEVE